MSPVGKTKKDLKEIFGEEKKPVIQKPAQVDNTHIRNIKASDTKTIPPTSKSGNIMQRIHFGNIMRAMLILLTLGFFLVALPYLAKDLSQVAQAFVKSTNFTIESNALDTDLKDIHKAAQLKTDGNGKTNIMIVGIDTRDFGRQTGIKNTDTMIVASYDHKTNRLSMISTPRDLVVNYPSSPSYGKINATYAIGESRNRGSGLEYLKQALENLTGLKIQYYVMMNLDAFRQIIDQLGGIDVYVEHSFTDYRYPTDNYRYRTVSFQQGLQHLTGDGALAYARSRKAAQVIESSDFARARRQQKVIDAVIAKGSSQETLQNPKKIFDILNTVANNIEVSQVTLEDIQAGLDIFKAKGKPTSYSLVLDPTAGNSTLIQVGGGGTGYTITPRAGLKNTSQIRKFVLDYSNEPTIVSLNPTIPVFNGQTGSFYTKYKNVTGRFFFMKFYNAGNTDSYTGDFVFNLDGPNYESLGKYIAGNIGATYVLATDPSVKAPRSKGGQLVIVLGK